MTAQSPTDQKTSASNDRSIRAERDVVITGTVITGDIGGDVHIHETKVEIPPPPEPPRPPEIPNFVGREHELTYYTQLIRSVHIAVITGMAGMGKTALATKLAGRVASPFRTFWHAFHEGEGFQSVVWKLAGFLAWHGQGDLWRMLQTVQQTGGQLPPPETIFDYLLQMVQRGGFLLCFDDFQFVEDDPLVSQLVDRLREAVLSANLDVIITSRHVPAFVQVVQVEPLSGLNSNDTRTLLSVRGLNLSDELAEELHARTSGNLQFLTLAIDSLKQARRPEHLIANLAETDDIERYLLAEVDKNLDEDSQRVMTTVAALLGYPGTSDAIEAVLDGGSVRRTLRELLDRNLLIVSEGEYGREYAQHSIVQAFYYDMMGRKERREIHTRAGEYYEYEERDVLRAANHYFNGTMYEQSAKLVAENTQLLINLGQARPLLELVNKFGERQVPEMLWIDINLTGGRVHSLLRDGDSARKSYQRALAKLLILDETDVVRIRKAEVCKGMGELLEPEDPPEALVWLEQGLDYLGQVDSKQEAALLIALGIIHSNLGNFDDAGAALEKGMALLPTEALQLRSEAYTYLSFLSFNQGEFTLAIDYSARALAINQQFYDYEQMLKTLSNQGIVRYASGQWADAIADFEQALALAERLGGIELLASTELNLGAAFINPGRYNDAHRHLERSLQFAEKANSHYVRITALYRLADLDIRHGQFEQAFSSLLQAEELAKELDVKWELPAIYASRSEIELQRNNATSALEYAELAVRLAEDQEMDYELGMNLRVFAEALFAAGMYDKAIIAYEQSASVLDSHDPYEKARTQMAWGKSLYEMGTADEARSHWIKAQATFQQLGAELDLAKANTFLDQHRL